MMDESRVDLFKAIITIQPLRIMTAPYFQSLREMTENFSHYV